MSQIFRKWHEQRLIIIHEQSLWQGKNRHEPPPKEIWIISQRVGLIIVIQGVKESSEMLKNYNELEAQLPLCEDQDIQQLKH
jgi:hypothetical protein